ncbi:hypothetical protein F2Q68_00000834 [Brassica cretica]|uniref:Uncharacterized protein n=1 Tax=Brassica cretica TaxID=69181 RepID=A0A8S9J6S8_BRACR|nr:hypothetical protein F2Q68_00000834 [Brassica cretica]
MGEAQSKQRIVGEGPSGDKVAEDLCLFKLVTVDLISGSGFVVSGYPSRYSIIRGYPDPDPDPSK